MAVNFPRVLCRRQLSVLTHVGGDGKAQMVDVSAKLRCAHEIARGARHLVLRHGARMPPQHATRGDGSR